MTESRRVAYWATDAEGTPADAAPKRNDYAVYHFNVPDGGLVVMQELGRLNVSGVDDFSGTLTGEGLVGVADNAVIDFGDGATALPLLRERQFDRKPPTGLSCRPIADAVSA